MANKKKLEERESILRRKRTERTIQIVGGIVLGLIVIGVIWLSIPGKSSNVIEVPTTTSLQYNAYPPMTIDTSKQYFATFKMAKGGEFVVQLFPDKAPKTV